MFTEYSAVTSCTAIVESVRLVRRTSGASCTPMRLTAAEKTRSAAMSMSVNLRARRRRERRAGPLRHPFLAPFFFPVASPRERIHDIRQDLALECFRVCRVLRAGGGAWIRASVQRRDVARGDEPGRRALDARAVHDRRRR